MPSIDLSLYLVTDSAGHTPARLFETVDRAIDGGVTIVQLREKAASGRTFYELARELRALTHRRGVPFIINDRVDIALSVDADGVHVGQSDLPADVVRRLIGNDRILGVSASTVKEALCARRNGADYIGAGAVFPTLTKQTERLVDAAALRAIRDASGLPVAAIGGLKASNLDALAGSGVDGICVVSAIMGADNPAMAAQGLRLAFDAVRGGKKE